MPEPRKAGRKSKGGSSKAKKLALFRRGAEAAHRVAGYEGQYYCPICKNGYTAEALESGALTLEHVPQASIGGRGIALTCKVCNNTAGHTVDAAVHQRDQVEAFARMVLRGEGEGTHPGFLRIGGDVLNAQIALENGGQPVVELRPGNNNPAALQRLNQRMTEMGGLGGDLQITARARYHVRLAKVGELRSAFLAAFALLGYNYAFHPYLDPVRQQIMQHDEKIINGWTLEVTTNPPRNVIALVRDPQALVVQIGARGVLLPVPGGPSDLYEQLAARYTQGEFANFRGVRRLGWPASLEMRLDFQDPEAE